MEVKFLLQQERGSVDCLIKQIVVHLKSMEEQSYLSWGRSQAR